MYDQWFTVKLLVLFIGVISLGWFLFNRLGDSKYEKLKEFGPLYVSLFNIVFVWCLYLVDDFYFLEFYLIGGAGVVAALCSIWGFREKKARFKKTTYIVNSVFIIAYTLFWSYVYALGKAWSI